MLVLVRMDGLLQQWQWLVVVEREERTSPQAVHFAEVRLLVCLGLGTGLGFSVTELLASVTVR